MAKQFIGNKLEVTTSEIGEEEWELLERLSCMEIKDTEDLPEEEKKIFSFAGMPKKYIEIISADVEYLESIGKTLSSLLDMEVEVKSPKMETEGKWISSILKYSLKNGGGGIIVCLREDSILFLQLVKKMTKGYYEMAALLEEEQKGKGNE